MTYFHDLTLIRYHDGPHRADDWQCPLFAVGWLERAHPFSPGPCPPGITEKVAELRDRFRGAFPAYSFRELHACSMCGGTDALLRESHINLFIPGDDVVYLVPGRIDHYIAVHAYAPPAAFIDALMRCPDPASDDYRAALFRLNRGQVPPLFA